MRNTRAIVALAALVVPALLAGGGGTAVAAGPTIVDTVVEFPDTAVGSTNSEVVTVYNDTGAALPITTTGSAPTGGPFTVDDECNGMNLADGDSCQIRYTFAPTSPGAFRGTAPLAVNGQPFPVALGGYGVPAKGTISGTITLVNADPAATRNVYVTALDGSVRHVFHNVPAAYAVDVPPGAYCVSFGIGPWEGTLVSYPGKRHCLDGITPVTVSSGSTVTNVDATLTLASVSGVVRDEDGTPVPNRWLWARLAGSGTDSDAMSDASGVFKFVNLAPGTYCVSSGPTTDPADPPCPAASHKVEVAAGANVTGIDIRLSTADPGPDTPGGISGTVTDAGSAPVAGREVVAVPVNGIGWDDSATTRPDGTYTIEQLLPGDYCVYVANDGSPLAGEYYSDAASCDTADLVSVGDEITTGIDFELTSGASLSGQIRTPENSPASSAWVWVRSEHTDIEVTADAAGNYTVDGLSPGSYCVIARDYGSFRPATAYGRRASCAEAIPVTVGTTAVTGIDIRLAAGGRIAGTVDVPAGFVPGLGHGRVQIRAVNRDGDASGDVWVDAAGHYATDLLAPGKYCVSFEPLRPSLLVDTIVGSAGQLGCADDGTIEVADGEVTNLDVALELGGSVSGWVITPSGYPHGDPSPRLDPWSGQNDRVRPDGSYFVTGVKPGSYCVSVDAWGLGILSEAYDDQLNCSAGYTPVTVEAGENTGNVNFLLGPAGTVRGVVTRRGGPGTDQVELHRLDAAQQVVVAVSEPYSSSQAMYWAQVPPGTYCVLVRPHAGSGNANTAHGGTPGCEGSTPVVVGAMETVDADITLLPQIYVPLDNPARLADTRPGRPVTAGAPEGTGPVAAGAVLEVQVAGVAGIPDDAASVALNLTAVAPQGPGHLTAYPCGEAPPTASNVNYNTGETRPNAVIARIGGGGKVCIRTHATTDVIVDVAGYFPGSDGFVPLLNPARVIDTRPDRPVVDGAPAGGAPVAAGTTLEVQVTGLASVPAEATAVAMNVTAVGAQGPGHLAVFPCGQPAPATSNVNYGAGETAPNAVVSRIGHDGKVCIQTHATTDVIVDIAGYFVADGGFASLATPARLMDTRPERPTVDGAAAGVGALQGQTVYELQVGGRAGLPRSGASVALNVTALLGQEPGHLTVFPCGEEAPTASNVNYLAGQTIPNAVIAKLGEDGKVCIRAHSTVDVIVDAFGLFPAGDGPDLGISQPA